MILNIPVNALQQRIQKHCPILTILLLPSSEKWLSLLIISCRMRPTIRSVRLACLVTSCVYSFVVPEVFIDRLSCFLLASTKFSSLSNLDTIPGSRYETLVLCCSSAWNKPSSPSSEFDRYSSLRGWSFLEAVISVMANVCTANLLK